MKRKELIKLLEQNGWVLIRNGANHDIYYKDGEIEPVPRHSEINEQLAKSIVRKRGLK